MSPNKYKDLPPKNNQKLYIWHWLIQLLLCIISLFPQKSSNVWLKESLNILLLKEAIQVRQIVLLTEKNINVNTVSIESAVGVTQYW